MRAIGVHPVDADEPVHLIELHIDGDASALDWASVTQPSDNPDPSYWQAAYDEQPVPGRQRLEANDVTGEGHEHEQDLQRDGERHRCDQRAVGQDTQPQQ